MGARLRASNMTGKVREIAGADISGAEQFRREIVEGCRPVVLRGLVRDWPMVKASLQSPSAFKDYLLPFDAGVQMEAFFGEPRIAGKYYYADDLKGFNFERRKMRLGDGIEAIVANLDHPAQSVYVGSLPIAEYLPGLAAQNPMPLLAASIGARIWLGHASNVSPHYDTLDNLACVVAGVRRFTLYAPDLLGGLYVGPIDNTMAGQPVSLAASSEPDDEKYPLFRGIRDQALVAELQPGDALYLPKLWWHKVEATAPFNGLINYWWDAFSAGPDAPYTSLLLSMITIAERPLAERLAWRALFDHYVFRERGHPLAHLPAAQHGILGPLKENYGKLRARIMHMLRGA
jgi:Cupin-like domain